MGDHIFKLFVVIRFGHNTANIEFEG
jgi:hypothetical protein